MWYETFWVIFKQCATVMRKQTSYRSRKSFSSSYLAIPEKFIMMRSEEMDSAHMVHKGGANPPSCLMHHSVSWTKYTAKPAKKTRKSWHTEKYKQIEMTTELWKAELFGTADFFDNWTLDIWFPVNCLKGQLAPVQVSWTVSYIINCKMFSC